MIYMLTLMLGKKWPLGNLLHYITFRAILALFTSFFVVFVLGPWFIGRVKTWQRHGQPIREDGPATHLVTKIGTPTMGGGLMLLGWIFAVILWVDWRPHIVAPVIGVTLGMGLVGAIDDLIKLSQRHSQGLSGRVKLAAQFAVALTGVYALTSTTSPIATTFWVPFVKFPLWNWGALAFVLFGAFVVVGSSNAVNLTDGLDGLAIGPVMIASSIFAIIAYVVGHKAFAHYLQLPFVPGSGELTVICAALVGSGLGFLWYNSPPAMIFMGDIGSLALGGALGMCSIVTKHEIIWACVGGVFVMEALSVIIQVFYYKRTRQRIFLMAPLHHHFEKKGIAEPTVVMRFWIVAILLGLIGLATLKIR